ncbi:hypothetical protein [Vibrio sp. SCSIO 43137]|uniref:hypothetical protein n=1 Tax=Vibrio sp. SCSIO 43137 TaxID=3021011 RepID=UPI0023077380|nr:hypothetical protein [Vibrio sp. SCSIO 43137]WCE31122.1 hypothetical protein PK654_07610 [Vibrio sp. SCSIO 43137]
MSHFESDDLVKLVSRLSISRTPSDIAFSWLEMKGKYPELSGVIHLDDYDKDVLPCSISKYTKEPNNYLTPYFKSENLYFIDDEMLKCIFLNGTNDFLIDYTVMFDTNMASYIKKLVRGESVGEVQNKLLTLIDGLLRDQLNFDFLFYLVENIKVIMITANFEARSKLEFWLSLDKAFRENLCCLHLFASINCEEYKRTLNPRYTVSFNRAAHNAMESAYDFYVNKKSELEAIMLMQRNLLLNLIGMIRIQEESNRNERNKMTSYLKFMHETIGLYMDREAIIAHKYFSSRSNLPILNQVHKNCNTKRLLKKLDNIAWDMAVPRIMEKLIPLGMGSEGHYFVPMFLSFDKNLRKMLKMHPIKGTVYNRDTGDIVTLPDTNSSDYFSANNLGKEINWICSNEQRNERKQRSLHTRSSTHQQIIIEYRKLLNVLKKQPAKH